MKKTTGMWILLVTLIAAPIFIWESTQEAPAPANVAANAVPATRTTAPARVGVQPVSNIDREAIARDLRLVDRIELMHIQRGADDLVLDELQMSTLQACGLYRGIAGKSPLLGKTRPELSLDAVRGDATRAWAFEYLEQACEGIDLEALSRDYRQLMPDWVIALRDKDEAAAIALALDDLHNAESDAALVMGLRFLERRGKSPLQTTYRSRDDVANGYIVGLAINPIRCRALEMCGSHNVQVAGACLLDGCLRGTTMEQYLRSHLSPKEIDAALKLRADLERYRASPVRR